MTALALTLIAVRLATLVHAAVILSVSYDETEYLYSGFRILTQGDWSVNPHPPLGKLAAALPVVLGGASPTLDGAREPLPRLRTAWHEARRFVHRNPTMSSQRMLLLARLPMLLMWALLAWGIFAWARSMYGDAGGLVSLCVYLACPTMAAAGQVVGTDLPCAVFATLALWQVARSWGNPTPRAVALVGLLFGLSGASRVQGLGVATIALVCVVVGSRRGGSGPLAPTTLPAGVLVRRAALVLVATLVTIAAFYAFQPRWVPHYWEGATFHSAVYYGVEGRDLYFLDGRYSTGGWWDYFPRLVLYKFGPWRLALLLVALASLGRGMRPAEWLLVAPAAVAFAAGVVSGINYSFRHILMVWPLMWVLVGRVAAGRPRVALAVVALVVLPDVVDTARVHPHNQSYVSPLVGGATEAYRRIADNTLDTGQGLADLDAALEARGNAATYLAYFGQGDPNAEPFRLRYRALPMRWHAADLVIHEPSGVPPFPRYVSVSAFYLQLYGRGIYHWLLAYEPIARPGYSILVYDRRGRPEFLAYLGYTYVAGALAGPPRMRVRSLSERRLNRAVELLVRLRKEDPRGWETARPWIDARLDDWPEERLWLGRVLRQAGWRDEARRQIDRLLERGGPPAIVRAAREFVRLDRR